MKKLLPFLLLVNFQSVFSQLRLPAIFADHMVLQRNQANPVWGWAQPGSRVQVAFKGKIYAATADTGGEWSVQLEPQQPGSAGTLRICSGTESVSFTDLAVGDVWICSGQSNMEWRMDMLSSTYPEELSRASNSRLRFMTVHKRLATSPVKEVEVLNAWQTVTPASVGNCSAVAYWFGKMIRKELGVPVGLIVSAWGGTPAQAWTSYEGLSGFPHYRKLYEEKIRPLDLNQLSRMKNELFQQFQQEVQVKYDYTRRAMQPDFDDADWKYMELPRPWEESGYPALDGVVAYRITFTVSEADAGKPAILHMPGIDDIDSAWINGRFIGSTDVWDKPRTYVVPAGVLKAGVNLLAVRVQDNQGGGGFAAVPDSFYTAIGDQRIPLAGKAKFKVIAELKDLTAGHGAIEHQPAVIYNAMIAPLMKIRFRGVIWYQGESNADDQQEATEYRTLFPSMIRDWRSQAGRPFPFLFVQLASFGAVKAEPGTSNWALLREAQLHTLRLPRTGMAVALDVGNPLDIHPVKKKEVGERLAAEALRVAYGQQQRISQGPLFQSATVRGHEMTLRFLFAGKGLVAKGGPLKQFALAGADRKFYWAEAEIRNNQVVLRCAQVPNPVAVRYAWADSPVDANLYNAEGYPASPFRSDNW